MEFTPKVVALARRQDIDGRSLIVAAALKLFSEQGIDAVSIRAVNREAGLGPASVHYHFGTKDALVDAVLHVHGDTISEAITTRARELVEAPQVATSRDIVEMLASPYLDLMNSHSATGQDWIKLVSQIHQVDPARVTNPESAKLARKLAARVYPDATPMRVDRAMRMCFSLLVAQLAQFGPVTRSRSKAALDLDLLVDFLSGGLDAALSPDAYGEERSAAS